MYQVVTDDLWDDLAGRPSIMNYLFLEPHPTLPRQWKVEGEDPTFSARLEKVISRFDAVTVWGYDKFAKACEEHGYIPVFMEDPSAIFEWKASLNAEPGVEVESKLDGRLDRNGTPLRLVSGFLPFQAVGVNFQKYCDRCVYFQWSTGTGKTLAAEGTILWRRENGYGKKKDQGFDLCLYVVKPNNLFNAHKKLNQHTGLESRILRGTPKRRERLFAEALSATEQGEQPILIFNAEKFREDTESFKSLVTNRNVLVIFDEMPEKYSNRTSALYRATAEVFYTSHTTVDKDTTKERQIPYPLAGKDRTRGVFFVGMCATPIRNAPEDFFNCIRMMDSTIYGSINNFNTLCVAERDRWHNVISWKNLDLFGSMAQHVVHQATKRRPKGHPKTCTCAACEIANQFPEKLPPETDYCDMDPASEKLYGILQAEYDDIGKASMLDFDEILAAIGVFQMICDNPRSVLDSAIKHEAYLVAMDAFLTTGVNRDHILWTLDTDEGYEAFCSCGWNGEDLFESEKSATAETKKHRAQAIKDFEKKNREGSEVALKLRELVGDDSKFTDKDKKGNCIISKMIKLRGHIEQHDGKVVLFSTKNQTLLPYIAEWFDLWGITYVTYHGELSAKQKQKAQDEFRQNPDIQVFLGTDAGKDSIDLPEADLTINYNDPWTAAAKEQRRGREDRIDSLMDVLREITLRVPFTVEDRKEEIIQTKQGYHDNIFDGEIADQAAEITKSSYLYVLTGQR